VPADTLVIHGEEDEVIPLSAVLDWASAGLAGAGVSRSRSLFPWQTDQAGQMIQRCW
jgi:alpha/beta superfamily hydrolase